MPPFHRSVMNITTAQQGVADSAGASGDAEMLVRAGRALDATAQKWNRIRWRFLLTEAPNISLIAPFTVTGVSTTVNSNTVTTTSNFTTAGVSVDDLIVGGGFDNESTVATTGATALTMNASALANATGTATFYRTLHTLPADFKTVYDARLLNNPRPLFYVQRRRYDRMITMQQSPSIPVAYDLFLSDSGGQIRLVPINMASEVLKLRYFRRITMPTLTATAFGLDIPQDTEDVFLAAAKSYFLIDKEGPSSERTQYWGGYAEKGLKEILNDTNVIPDEDLKFQPSAGTGYGQYFNPNSTVGYDDWF